MPKIIAVDFDGTLCFDRYPEIGLPREELIEHLKRRQQSGDRLILWTCRTGELLFRAVHWCALQGLFFDAVNENLPDIVEKFGGDTRKVFANEYLDDRNTQIQTDEDAEALSAVMR